MSGMTLEQMEIYLLQWDKWRKYIADGGGSDWPRLAFESVMESIWDDGYTQGFADGKETR